MDEADEADGAVETNNRLYTESIAISMQVLESGSPLRVEAKLEIGQVPVQRAQKIHRAQARIGSFPPSVDEEKNIEGNKETLSPKTTTQRREITSPRL